MNFSFNTALAEKYRSLSQKIRVLTESWVFKNLYCPVCGAEKIESYENNHPTGDFFCECCKSDFELKSKESTSGKLAKTITDGAYDTMISRITSSQNPHFFFLTYINHAVSNCILIPNYFFTPKIIIKRPPLSLVARRAGWVGCNIDISAIPESGKIFVIKKSNRNSSKRCYSKIRKNKIIENYKLGISWLGT